MSCLFKNAYGADIAAHIREWSRCKQASDYKHTISWSTFAYPVDYQTIVRGCPWNHVLTKVKESDLYLLCLGRVLGTDRSPTVFCTVDRCGLIHRVSLADVHVRGGYKYQIHHHRTDQRDSALAMLRCPGTTPDGAGARVTLCSYSDLNPDEVARWETIRCRIRSHVPRLVDSYMKSELDLHEVECTCSVSMK